MVPRAAMRQASTCISTRADRRATVVVVWVNPLLAVCGTLSMRMRQATPTTPLAGSKGREALNARSCGNPGWVLDSGYPLGCLRDDCLTSSRYAPLSLRAGLFRHALAALVVDRPPHDQTPRGIPQLVRSALVDRSAGHVGGGSHLRISALSSGRLVRSCTAVVCRSASVPTCT